MAALASYPTRKEAAEALGMGLTTLHTRTKKPEFQKRYREFCLKLLDDHAAALQVNMGAAISTQREIMDDKGNSPQVRLNAASEILRYGLSLTDRVNILGKLKALENEDESS